MQLTRGRHLLFPDRPGFPDRGGCASGDAVGAGGFLWGGGLVVRGCRFFPAPGQEFLVSGSGILHSVQKCMGEDRWSGGAEKGWVF